MTDGEIKGKEFLEFVGNNLKKLKKNLKKNITYDPLLFDDIFHDSIIKVYNSIVKNNKVIDDYEQYFFIASKYNFIVNQNKKRKMVGKITCIEDVAQKEDIIDKEYQEIDTQSVIKELTKVLYDNFEKHEVDMYMEYMMLKSTKNISYLKYAQMMNLPLSNVSLIISKIKKFCQSHKYIKDI